MDLTYTLYLSAPIRNLRGDIVFPMGTVVTDEVIKQSLAYGLSNFFVSVHKPA